MVVDQFVEDASLDGVLAQHLDHIVISRRRFLQRRIAAAGEEVRCRKVGKCESDVVVVR
jgi:hypothetical protein